MIFLLAYLWLACTAFAFPEMVRHGYVNCNACHVSPSGGGLLTPYGRMTATELLSTWGSEKEAMFLHGRPNPEKFPAFLNLGGDVRMLQVHRENRFTREGAFIFMQAGVEAAVTVGSVTAAGAFGRPDRQTRRIEPEFTRFYLLTEPVESLQLRAGRFLPAFGLNEPHHTIPTRAALGFGYNSERDQVEAQWSGESWHGAAAASQSRVVSKVAEKEKAASFQLEKFFAETYRLGVSVWKGDSEKQSRWLWSGHGILGFTKSLYALTEYTWQSRRAKVARADRETGLFQFTRLGYEWTKGLHLLGLQEFSKSDLARSETQFQSFGAGMLWYPRPHFEFEITFNQRRSFQRSHEWEDYAYLMLHYYL